MAVRICFLSLLLIFSVVVPGSLFVGRAGATRSQCLACHSPHYTTLGACTDCHRGDNRTQRVDLAHRNLIPASMAGFALPMDRKTQYGLRLLDRMSCRRCHVWNGRGNRLATDLDQVYFTSSVENLKSALHDPVDHMPDFALDDGQVEAAITGLLGVSRMVSPAKEVPPVIVYFDNKVGQRHHPFELRCGGCHRALTVRFGALGKGSVGPNLSGLLSEYYPKDGSGAFWTAERLGRWLANPRQLRANALMQPVFLTNDEVGKILDGFNPEAEYMRVEVSP